MVVRDERTGTGELCSLVVAGDPGWCPVSVAEQQNGSAAALEALRASVRCGRTLPVVHLTELEETVSQRHYHRDPIVLCSADVSDLDYSYDDPDGDCPGCRDCLRYCPDCVREAARFSAEAGQLDHAPRRRPLVQDDDGGPVGYVMTGDCPHPVYGGPAWHVGLCAKCERQAGRAGGPRG
ncbi:MAG: hypothetical protein ACRDTF_07035 [Pseudonocardiaceae bacterium]